MENLISSFSLAGTVYLIGAVISMGVALLINILFKTLTKLKKKGDN